ALATDIGGGPYLSMLDVLTSFVRQNQAAGMTSATFSRGLYRSTQAGADVLDLGGRKGSFTPGKDLDFISVKASSKQLNASSADAVLAAVLLPLESDREAYESLILKTVVEGGTVFQC
ncbi:MAG: amidohydrolase family protein, partial [Verrucomicrobia bacterium]|nr:amidohydrolase family protein [Verrucomicrobiota bacterium]